MPSTILTRGDFKGNPDYAFHFSDLCETFGLKASPGKVIESIEITGTAAINWENDED